MPSTQSDQCYKPGTIKSLSLINFMCHESFHMTLGPRVNFIIGPNGSGKSAILTAIVFALGARASITSRAKKANDFVMYGKNSARVTLVIHNYDLIMEKDQAFKPDDYGKYIILEKTIFKEECKLVLKSDKGKKVSERKQELDEMLEHFGILINNPICILNQEVSKTFLHSKRPEDKFDLFKKATNLESIEEDYNEAKRSHKDWDECNESKQVAFRLLDKEQESCLEKLKFLETKSKLNSLREKLNNERYWAIIRDGEKLSEDLKKKIKLLDKSIAESQESIENRKGKISTCESEIQIMNDSIKAAQDKIQETRKKIQSIRSNETEIRTKRVNVVAKMDQCKRKIGRSEEDKNSLEKSIADIKKQFRDRNALDQDNEYRKMEIERIERELQVDTAREKSIRLHTDQLSTSMTSTRGELHGANMRQNELKGKLSQHQALLRRLKNGQENTIRKYGDHVVRIRDEIDSAHKQGRFKHKPIGPLGFYIKLRSQDVAPALECHLGRNVHAFACDNHRDMSILSSIFKKIQTNSPDFKQPTIITRPFGCRHDVSRFKSNHHTYKTFADYIETEHDAIFNALADRTNLESVLFIPDYHAAEALMLDISQVPKNTRCAYTKDCAVMHPRSANGGYKSFTNNPKNYVLFSDNNAPQIRVAEREIELINGEIRDAENIVRGIQDSLNVQRKEYDSNNTEIRRLLAEMRRKEEQLLELKTTVAVEPQELSALEEELENTMTSIAEEKVNIEKFKETLASLERDLKDIGQEMKEAERILEKHDTERRSVEKIIESTIRTMAEHKDSIKRDAARVANLDKEKAEANEKLEESLEKTARFLQHAPEGSNRPKEIRKTEEIQEELNKVEVQIRVDEEEERDPEEVKASLHKRIAEIQDISALKDFNLRNCKLASKSLADRFEGLNILREQTVSGVSNTFTQVMRSMKMNGDLSIHFDDVIEHGEVVRKAGTLHMRVDTNYTPSQRTNIVMNDVNNGLDCSGDQQRLTRSQPASMASRPKRMRRDGDGNSVEKENEIRMTDTRSLSGGERSFSTVAFVLALWNHCASPFKLMDEIDVFMDMVTRRVSYNFLIRYSQMSGDTGQFIFFSPLELPNFENADTVRVFEMPEVVRKRPIET